MTYTISKDFSWSASHQLPGLPEGHPCGRLHGHNYVARVEISALLLDPVGFVLDYGLLAPFGQWIDDTLDHRHLNDVDALAGRNPTAENLARMLARALRQVAPVPAGADVAVSVSETPKTWATYRSES
jgi:6-pyruvoyltetrahydropterin/6-carboxytetrahydropterin synthase